MLRSSPMATERLGDWVLEERIARGGMGEVWRARGPDGRIVCIKRLDASLRSDVDFIEMFRDEASLVADLDHENVIHLIELIDNERELAQVIEFVDGPSLARVRGMLGDTGGDFTLGEALQIAVYLCRALHHAHTRRRDGAPDGLPLQIVHRDVSPQNILLDRQGRLKLVDFGIARAAQRLTRTRDGMLKGKLSYMAPEQARGEPLDHRADQFAAGILVWEMLTGRRLFAGRNEHLILEQVQQSDPVPPSTVKRGIPRDVDAAVLRALRWHPDERFFDMAAFERALQSCLDMVQGATSSTVDLAPLVARTLAHLPERTAVRASEGVVHTRVLVDDPSGAERSETEENPRITTTEDMGASDPRAHPRHTGEFFNPRRAGVDRRLFAAGAFGVFGLVALVAVLLRPRDPPPAQTLPIPPAASTSALDELETRVRSLGPHPCRTELLDDFLDKRPLGEAGMRGLAAAVDDCGRLAALAPRERETLREKNLLEFPAWPKKKRRTRQVVVARAAELERRGALAFHAGEYDAAKKLLVEALRLDPSRVDDHARLGQTLRGLGDARSAGRHLRLWLHLHPEHDDRERVERYLARYREATALAPATEPELDERYVRAARLLRDADAAEAAHADPLPALEAARALLPRDGRVLLRLGEAYADAGRQDEARPVLEAALKLAGPVQGKKIRARLDALGPPAPKQGS